MKQASVRDPPTKLQAVTSGVPGFEDDFGRGLRWRQAPNHAVNLAGRVKCATAARAGRGVPRTSLCHSCQLLFCLSFPREFFLPFPPPAFGCFRVSESHPPDGLPEHQLHSPPAADFLTHDLARISYTSSIVYICSTSYAYYSITSGFPYLRLNVIYSVYQPSLQVDCK